MVTFYLTPGHNIAVNYLTVWPEKKLFELHKNFHILFKGYMMSADDFSLNEAQLLFLVTFKFCKIQYTKSTH